MHNVVEFPRRRAEQGKRVLNVDWADLELAFRDATGIENLLDKQSGEIVSLLPGFSDEKDLRDLIAREPHRFVAIEPIGAGFARQVMAAFIDHEPDSKLKQRLTAAQSGSGSFTRCLALLKDDDLALSRYYRFEQMHFWRHVEEQLTAQGVTPATRPPGIDLFEGRARS